MNAVFRLEPSLLRLAVLHWLQATVVICKVENEADLKILSRWGHTLKKGIEDGAVSGTIVRKLGPMETFYAMFHDLGSIITAYTLRVRGSLNATLLSTALERLQQRHPLLRVGIVETSAGRFFQSSKPAPLPLQTLNRRSEDHWLEVVETELHKQFSTQSGPLCRAILLTSSQCSELILTLHHSISDGLSAVQLFDDLLEDCSRLAAGEVLPDVVSLPVLPAIEDLTDSHLTVWKQARFFAEHLRKQWRPTKRIVEVAAPLAERRTRIRAATLSAEETAALIGRCKQEQTTVQGALCAAMLFAAARYFASPQPVHLSCTSTVNLRSDSTQPVHEQIGCFASIVLEAVHTVHPATDFWSLARECKGEIGRAIARRTPHEHFLMLDRLKLGKPFFTGLIEADGGRTETVLVSNCGRIRLRQTYGPFEVEGFSFIGGQQAMGSSLWLCASTFADRLTCCFGYPSPVLQDATAAELIDAVRFNLDRAARAGSFAWTAPRVSAPPRSLTVS